MGPLTTTQNKLQEFYIRLVYRWCPGLQNQRGGFNSYGECVTLT